MDNFISFLQDKAALIAVAVLLAGLLVRGVVFAGTVRNPDADWQESKIRYAAATLGRLLLPLQGMITVKPVYTTLRYLFHLGLLMVLLAGSSHLAVLKSLHLSWLFPALPESLVDRSTFLIICCLLFFMVRKLAMPAVRNQAKWSEAFFVGMVALPVVSGYLAHHGWLDFELLLALHLVSAITLMFCVLFLFCRSTVDTEKCTGCRACSVSCPTGALKAIDNGGSRVFEYSHYQCVCCATCVSSCPEGAVSLKHRMGFRYAVESRRVPDRVLPLHQCEQCGQSFTSNSQLEQIDRLIKEQGLELSSLYLCERCKRRSTLYWARPLAMRRVSGQDFQSANS